MKTRYRILGSVVLIMAVLAVTAAVAYAKYRLIEQKASGPKPPEMPVAVRLKVSAAHKYRQQTTVIGTVLAPQSIMLSNEVAGTVKTIGFKPGSPVEAGQILVELDTSVEQAELLSAQARVRLTKSTLARMRRAATTDAVTAAEVEEAEAQFDQANASVEQLKAVIDRKTLRAPFRANIGLCNTHVGQFLPSGFQIATLQSIDDFLHIDFMIPQTAADWVKVGDPVKLVDGTLSFPATIVALDARADRLSRNLMARARLSPVPQQLVPGDSVRVVVEFGPELESTVVPLKRFAVHP